MDGSANTADSFGSAPAASAPERVWRRYLKQTPLESLQPRRICIVKPSALGDIVQTLPVLSMLRQRFPHAHVAWVIIWRDRKRRLSLMLKELIDL